MYIIKLLYSFKGQINRLEYVWGNIILVSLLAVGIFSSNLFPHPHTDIIKILIALKFVIFVLASLYTLIAIAAKRLKDIGWTLWLIPIILIPYIGIPMHIILIFVPGKKNVNTAEPCVIL